MSRNGSSLMLAILLAAAPVGAALAHQGPAGLGGAPAAPAIGSPENSET